MLKNQRVQLDEDAQEICENTLVLLSVPKYFQTFSTGNGTIRDFLKKFSNHADNCHFMSAWLSKFNLYICLNILENIFRL